MAKKTKKRVFSKEHREKIAAAARARYAAKDAKPKGKRGRPAKAKTDEATLTITGISDTNTFRVGDKVNFDAAKEAPSRMVTKHEMAMDVVFSTNDQQVKALALQILSGSNY